MARLRWLSRVIVLLTAFALGACQSPYRAKRTQPDVVDHAQSRAMKTYYAQVQGDLTATGAFTH